MADILTSYISLYSLEYLIYGCAFNKGPKGLHHLVILPNGMANLCCTLSMANILTCVCIIGNIGSMGNLSMDVRSTYGLRSSKPNSSASLFNLSNFMSYLCCTISMADILTCVCIIGNICIYRGFCL